MILNWLLSGFVNWKTTVTGLVTALLIYLDSAGYIHIDDKSRAQIVAALIIIFSWFAKDSDKTGKPDGTGKGL